MRTYNIAMAKLLVSLLTLTGVCHITSITLALPPDNCALPLFDNVVYCVPVSPFSVATADLDGDGGLDLVTANFIDGTISILFNNGEGYFTNDVTYPAGVEPASIAINDLEDDRDLYLVVFSGGGVDLNGPLPGTISVLLNAGDGSAGVSDLLILFADCFPCDVCCDCQADLEGDCVVSTVDLLILFANWGP